MIIWELICAEYGASLDKSRTDTLKRFTVWQEFRLYRVLKPGFRSSGRRDEQTFRSERSLSPRLIRLRRKWASALRRLLGSNCSKSSNGSKCFERLEQLERFERSLY
jgi:hypothetical protein